MFSNEVVLGLINMKGRVYDPTLTRFLTPDPLITRPTRSESWNPYSYVNNSPLNHTDPTGYIPCGPRPLYQTAAEDCTNLQGKGINNKGAQAQGAWLGSGSSTWMGSKASNLWGEANARASVSDSQRTFYPLDTENPYESDSTIYSLDTENPYESDSTLEEPVTSREEADAVARALAEDPKGMGTSGIHIHIYQHHEVDLEWSLEVGASEQRIEVRAWYPGQTKEIIGQADKVITALGKTSGVGTE